jgi:saccharopine dehydrogenase-like NADP-dependent oxidoreductase
MAGSSLPPVLGLAFKGLGKRLVVITGTTSGLGLTTVKALLKRGDSFVVCAVRDTDKMKDIIKRDGLDSNSCAVLQLDLASFQSVKDFVFNLKVPPLNLSISQLKHDSASCVQRCVPSEVCSRTDE